MVKVMICGNFDPLHRGHLTHIDEAKKEGDYLIIATHPDCNIDRYKKHGCLIPLEDRVAILERLCDEVVVIEDEDGSVANTILKVKPNVFVKDGDRNPELHPIPQKEIDACEKVGCKIVYKTNPKENSSSDVKGDFLKKHKLI